jgi:quercetin dioxygenase-like cupin family protein
MSILVTLIVVALAGSLGAQTPARARVALDNAVVRAYRTTIGALTGVGHGPAVVVWLKDGASGKAGRAVWVEDAATTAPGGSTNDEIAIVQPRADAPRAAAPPAGSPPGGGAFTGMSFNTMFENARVSVIRARMEVDAREGLHTHGSDTVVVHLSGGEIEDTAAGKTVVNRWKPGDLEFEARGSSHSARNIGHPVDVVLVALKP